MIGCFWISVHQTSIRPNPLWQRWNSDWQKMNIRAISLESIPELEEANTQIPVVLVRRDNYGIDRLLNKHLDPTAVAQIQQQVRSGQRSMKFY